MPSLSSCENFIQIRFFEEVYFQFDAHEKLE